MILDTNNFFKAVDKFCLLADASSKVPKLKRKKYSDFKISLDEWEMLSLIHEVLKVPSYLSYKFDVSYILQETREAQSSFSSQGTPTAWKTIPILELLQDHWETFAALPKFRRLRNAIEKGLAKLRKYYALIDQSNVYFITLGMFDFIIEYQTKSSHSFGPKL